ncbi:unnamed protein product, partial [Rotaria magnacalcarata]
GALKRIETFSSSLLKNTDTIDDNESQTKKTQKYYEEEAKTYFEKTQKYVQIILKLAESRNE